MTGLLPAGRRALGLNLAAFAGDGNSRATVRVTLDAGSFARTPTQTSVDVSTVGFDQTGKEIGAATQTSTLVGMPASTDRAPLVNVSTHLDLEPGDYEVRVAVTDPTTAVTASVFGQILVPQFSTERLSLSDVAVEMGGAGPEARAAIAPTTQREFVRTDQVRAFLQIYQGLTRDDAIRPVTVRVRVLDPSGAAIDDQSMILESAEFRDRRADCRINLPNNRLERGDYLLEITATAGSERATRKLRFTMR